MKEPQWQQEAETFARVWQRVAPDPDTSPIQPVPLPAPAPAPPPNDRQSRLLRELIATELTQWRRCRALAQQTGQRPLTTIANQILRRARRLAGALFLRSQVWYLPLTGQRSPGRWPPRPMPRSGYSALFQGAQSLQVRYEAAARTTNGPELALFRSAVEELTREQRILLHLLSR